jgi:hypothetical protein
MLRLHSFLFLMITIMAVFPSVVTAQTRPQCGCVFVNGKEPQNVRIEFKGDPHFVPARANTVVHLGDFIEVTTPASATLICDNVSEKVEVGNKPRTRGVPCKQFPEEGILIGRNGRKLDSRTMGGSGFDFPVVLSPRATKLMNPRPILRWTALDNASTYNLTVQGENENETWHASVTANPSNQIQQMVYPAPCDRHTTKCAPALRAGESYKLIVEANGHSSEEEGLPNLGFALLPNEQIQNLLKTAKWIDALPVNSDLKTKMRASLYALNDLNGEAIDLLEHKVEDVPDTIRLLGDLYLKIGLTRKAESAYLAALKSDVVRLDTGYGKAITQETLGEIYESLGNKAEAIRFYSDAKRRFQVLNDRESVNDIQQRLAALTKP